MKLTMPALSTFLSVFFSRYLFLHLAKTSVYFPTFSQFKKGKGFPYSLPSIGPGADPNVHAVSLQVIHPAVGCHYFPPGLW